MVNKVSKYAQSPKRAKMKQTKRGQRSGASKTRRFGPGSSPYRSA